MTCQFVWAGAHNACVEEFEGGCDGGAAGATAAGVMFMLYICRAGSVLLW